MIILILNACGFIVCLYLIIGVLGALVKIFEIIKSRLIGGTIDKNLYKIFNPLNIYKSFSNNEDRKIKILLKIVFIVGIIGITFDIIRVSPYGSKTIGSFIEKKEYTQFYYVNMFAENQESKNYRVKAEINARIDEEESTNNDGDTTTQSIRHYYIEKAYFSNGGYITFTNNDEPLEINKKVSITDDDENYWKIELTSKKAE